MDTYYLVIVLYDDSPLYYLAYNAATGNLIGQSEFYGELTREIHLAWPRAKRDHVAQIMTAEPEFFAPPETYQDLLYGYEYQVL